MTTPRPLPDPPGRSLLGRRWSAGGDERLVWVLWAVFALLVAVVKSSDPSVAGDVLTVYRDAADRWLEGKPLYKGNGTEFIYLPQAAVLFTPFSVLSHAWGGALLRVANILIFAFGVRNLARVSTEGASCRFLLASVPAILMSWSSARAGQMTLAMGGMMMLAVTAVAVRRWWHAAAWLTAGLALKPLIIVLTLLVVAVERHTRWRVLVATTVLVALPFIAQAPAYVMDQYVQSVAGIGSAAELGVTMRFPQLFGMLELVGVRAPEAVQTIVRLLAAATTLVACVLARKRCSRREAAVLLYTLAVGYLLLFSPRTENNTYSLLAPAIGMQVVEAVAQQNRQRAWLLAGLVLLFLASNPLCTFVGMEHGMSIKPVWCAVFLVWVVHDLLHGSKARATSEPA